MPLSQLDINKKNHDKKTKKLVEYNLLDFSSRVIKLFNNANFFLKKTKRPLNFSFNFFGFRGN
jgi:transposase